MTEIDVAAVRARLHRVVEPCSIAMKRPVSIVQMGLVDDVKIDGGDIRVTLCLTDTACVHFSGMQRAVADALADLPGVETVAVVQTLDKLWDPDRYDEGAA
jgi:metal-sulfur cluster biosynthetic enzyme